MAKQAIQPAVAATAAPAAVNPSPEVAETPNHAIYGTEQEANALTSPVFLKYREKLSKIGYKLLDK